MGLPFFNLVFFVVAILARPSPQAIGHAFLTWTPFPGGGASEFLLILASNIGATVTPWMLFFQQSAVVDKGMTRADLTQARVDTGLGAAIAAAVAIATVVVTATLFAHHVDPNALRSGADFASALKPYIG